LRLRLQQSNHPNHPNQTIGQLRNCAIAQSRNHACARLLLLLQEQLLLQVRRRQCATRHRCEGHAL
jgi:hypothetical protein